MSSTHDTIASRLKMAPADVIVERKDNGCVYLRSPIPVETYPTLGALLDRAAREAPEQIFIAERSGSGWNLVNYRDAREQVRRMASALIRFGVRPDSPVAIVADNSVEIGLFTMAAHYIGVPVLHVTSAYATRSNDLKRLRDIMSSASPQLVYVGAGEEYAAALELFAELRLKAVLPSCTSASGAVQRWCDLVDDAVSPEVDAWAQRVDMDSPARLLYTSGSTSAPKAVMQTHGMLSWNAWARAKLWPFLDNEPLVLLDWMPWSHGFASSQNFTMQLWHKGAYYIDDGAPTDEGIERMVENIRLCRPNLMFSAPIAYLRLLPFLEKDSDLARDFFEHMKVLFYAGADMPRGLWASYAELSKKYCGYTPFFASSWGMTEIVAATYVHYATDGAGNIGLPMPGAEIKLAPVDDKYELRVRGRGTMSSYWKQPELNPTSFDEEGYFRTGDAGRLADENNPSAGLVYDGRIGENFKLASGRWVPVGALRLRAIAEGSPIVADVVVVGHGKDYAGLLVFLDKARCRDLLGEEVALVHTAEPIRHRLREMLKVLATGPEGLPKVLRMAVLPDEPLPGVEIGDKGYINQSAVMKRRADVVERLYSDEPHNDIISLD